MKLSRTTSSCSGRDEMDDLLRCFICFGRVKDAHLCPSCSKMCCRECIVKWLTERKRQCPHCRVDLNVSMLVKCRFVQDLSVAIDRLQNQSGRNLRETCAEHRQELQYFCKDCNLSICSDCAMFGTQHVGHAFERLVEVHEKHVRRVKKEVMFVQNRVEQLRKIDAEVESNIRAVKSRKEERSEELRNLVKDMESNLVSQLHRKLSLLLGRKNDIMKEMTLLESIVHELSCHLDVSMCPRSELIRKSDKLQKMAEEIQLKPISHFSLEPVSDEFKSEVVPEFHGALFHMHNFDASRNAGGVVYSEPLRVRGLTWRLKVYPNGNGVAKDAFMSVFLELTAGFPGTERYEYRVQMLNHRDPHKTLDRRFSSSFDVGCCWGYNRFFRIDAMERDGFLTEDGDLVLRFDVRPPTLYLAHREQERYIEHLERQDNDRELRIRDLELKLGALNTNNDNDVGDEAEAPEAEPTVHTRDDAEDNDVEGLNDDDVAEEKRDDEEPAPPEQLCVFEESIAFEPGEITELQSDYIDATDSEPDSESESELLVLSGDEREQLFDGGNVPAVEWLSTPPDWRGIAPASLNVGRNLRNFLSRSIMKRSASANAVERDTFTAADSSEENVSEFDQDSEDTDDSDDDNDDGDRDDGKTSDRDAKGAEAR